MTLEGQTPSRPVPPSRRQVRALLHSYLSMVNTAGPDTTNDQKAAYHHAWFNKLPRRQQDWWEANIKTATDLRMLLNEYFPPIA